MENNKYCAVYIGEGFPLSEIPFQFDDAALALRESLSLAGCCEFICAAGSEEELSGWRSLPCIGDIAGFIKDTAGRFGGYFVVTEPIYAGADLLLSLASKEEDSYAIMTVGSDKPYLYFFRAHETLLALLDGVNITASLSRSGGLYDLTDPLARHDAQSAANTARVRRFIQRGVNFIDPSTVYISPLAEIEAGALIYPQTIIKGKTIIGKDSRIGPQTVIDSCTVGHGSVINASQLVESQIGEFANIGPFAYIRPGTVLAARVKIGDFSEIKNSVIGEGTKVPHLSYVGDADVGSGVNFGCGSVVVNYDGRKKTRSVIEDNAFIGCNTNLVSPVTVGRGAYTAAGSTITKDVPAGSLAIARCRQEIKFGWADRRRESQK